MPWFELARVIVKRWEKGTDVAKRADDVIKEPNFWYDRDGNPVLSLECDEYIDWTTEDRSLPLVRNLIEVSVQGLPSGEDTEFSAINEAICDDGLDEVFCDYRGKFLQWGDAQFSPEYIPDEYAYTILCEMDAEWRHSPDEDYFVVKNVWCFDVNQYGRRRKGRSAHSQPGRPERRL